ncbi:hypothetical protein D9M71_447730 [compost metagenome]
MSPLAEAQTMFSPGASMPAAALRALARVSARLSWWKAARIGLAASRNTQRSASGVGPASAPRASLTSGPWGERRRVSVTGAASFTAICSLRLCRVTHCPACQTCSGSAGLTRSAIRSRSSFWNMVRLQPKSRL